MVYIKKLNLEQIFWLECKKKKIERRIKKVRHHREKLKRQRNSKESKDITEKKEKSNINSQSKLIGFSEVNDDWFKLIAPQDFSIENNHNLTVSFFNSILDFINEKPIGTKLDIISKEVEKVSASALMYLTAILFDAKSFDYIIKGDYPRNINANIFYQSSGFNNFIKAEKEGKIEPLQNNIKIIMGNNVNPNLARLVCEFASENCKGMDTKDLYAILIELMSNSRQHAYDENSRLDKKWLLFAEKNDCIIKFVFLDTGNGIPETVYKDFADKTRIALGPIFKNVHSELIQSAFMGEFRTQTKQGNRGQGLPQIEKYFSSPSVINASVFSGKGSYVVDNNYLGQKSSVLQDFLNDFNGTLYEWSVNRRKQI